MLNNITYKALMWLALSAFLLSHNANAAGGAASSIVSKVHSVTYQGGERESYDSMRHSAKEKLRNEFIDMLPTYVESIKTVSTTGYEQKVRFLVSSMLEIKNEKFEFMSGDVPIVKITATMIYDELEISRKIKDYSRHEENIKTIDTLIKNDREMAANIKKIKHMYRKTNLDSYTSTLDKQLKVLVELRDKNASNVTIISSSALSEILEHEREKKRLKAEEEKMKKELLERNEFLSQFSRLTDTHLFIKEIAPLFAKALHDYYTSEITAPRTLILDEFGDKRSRFKIVRADKEPIIKSWKLSFDPQLAHLYDKYPLAVFSKGYSCDTVETNKYDFKGYEETVATGPKYSLVSESGVMIGRLGEHKVSDFIVPAEDESFPDYSFAFSPRLNSPFLYYYNEGRMDMFHVDPHEFQSFDRYEYKITIGDKVHRKEFMRPQVVQAYSPKHEFAYNDRFARRRSVVTAPFIAEDMRKMSIGNRSTFDKAVPLENFKNNWGLIPKSPTVFECQDEMVFVDAYITIDNEVVENTDNIKIEVVKVKT